MRNLYVERRGSYEEEGGCRLATIHGHYDDFACGHYAHTKARIAPGETAVVDGRTYVNAGLVPGVGIVGLEEGRLIVFGEDGNEVRAAGMTAYWDLDGSHFAAVWAASETFAPLREWCEGVVRRETPPDEQVVNALNRGHSAEEVLARLERLHVLYGTPLPGHWERLDSAGIRLPKLIPGRERLPRQKSWVHNGSDVYTSGSHIAWFRLEGGVWIRDHWAQYQWSHR